MKEIDNLKISKKLIKAIISGAVFTILGGTAWAWSRPKKQDLSKIDHYGNPLV